MRSSAMGGSNGRWSGMRRGHRACPKKTVPQGYRLVEYPVPHGGGAAGCRLQWKHFCSLPPQNPSTPRAHHSGPTLNRCPPTPPILLATPFSMGTCKVARLGSPVTEAFPTVKTEESTTRQRKPGSCRPQTPRFHLHPQVPSAQLQALQPPQPLHVHC